MKTLIDKPAKYSRESIKDYNEETHVASDLQGEELYTLDESEIDDY